MYHIQDEELFIDNKAPDTELSKYVAEWFDYADLHQGFCWEHDEIVFLWIHNGGATGLDLAKFGGLFEMFPADTSP